MIKNKEERQQYHKEYMRKKRGLTEGLTKSEGLTGVEAQGLTKGLTPDIIDKLTSSFWRPRLEKICQAFKDSPYAQDVRVGVYGPDLETVSELLSATEGIPVVKSDPVLPVNRVEANHDEEYVVVGGMRLRKHSE